MMKKQKKKHEADQQGGLKRDELKRNIPNDKTQENMKHKGSTHKVSARERLIDAASKLMYEKGIPSVGIAEIIETANVSRMSLYNIFKNKHDLTIAVLERYLNKRREMVKAAFKDKNDPVLGIETLFDIVFCLRKEDNFRGCMFMNSAVQVSDPDSEVHQLVRNHKLWIKQEIEQTLLQYMDAKNAEVKAQQILMLWDGAIIESYIQQAPEPIDYALQSALSIVRTPTAFETVDHA